MRNDVAALGLLLAVGCGTREPPPSLPQAEAQPQQTADEVPAPTKPTPAFVPADQGRCERAYRLVEGTCVHRRYEAADESALLAAIAQYKQGAAPPMLAPRALARAPEPEPERKADPGSLMRKKAGDAQSAKQRRLAELDAMLALAHEKLAKRDAEGKAKQVANAPRHGRDALSKDGKDREGLEQFARGVSADLGGGRGGLAPGASESESARLSELSRVTSQLSSDQLKAISDELSKSGFNPGSLEALMKEAQEKPGM